MKTLQIEAIKNWCKVVAPKLPAAKLKGNGRQDRVRISSLVPHVHCPAVFAMIPHRQKDTVSIYRGKGFGGDVNFVSVPCAQFIRAAMSI